MLSDFCWFGGPWILDAGWLTKTATWGTQVVEVLIPLLLAFRRTWVCGFVLGTLLHLTIAITTPYLVLFSLSMVMIYLAFVRFKPSPSPRRSRERRPDREVIPVAQGGGCVPAHPGPSNLYDTSPSLRDSRFPGREKRSIRPIRPAGNAFPLNFMEIIV